MHDQQLEDQSKHHNQRSYDTFRLEHPVFGKLAIASDKLNILATMANLMLSACLCVLFYFFAADVIADNRDRAQAKVKADAEIAKVLKENHQENAAILREIARATREQNCINTLPIEVRLKNQDLCKRLAQ